MKADVVRTTVEIPAPLYRELKKRAAEDGTSVRQLMMNGVRAVLREEKRPRKHRVQFPLIKSKGPKVNLTNEQIYGQIEFP
jgi:hypothetical protein